MSPAIQYSPPEEPALIAISSDLVGLVAVSPVSLDSPDVGMSLFVHAVCGSINIDNAGAADIATGQIVFQGTDSTTIAVLGPIIAPHGKTTTIPFSFLCDCFLPQDVPLEVIVSADVANVTFAGGSTVTVYGGEV